MSCIHHWKVCYSFFWWVVVDKEFTYSWIFPNPPTNQCPLQLHAPMHCMMMFKEGKLLHCIHIRPTHMSHYLQIMIHACTWMNEGKRAKVNCKTYLKLAGLHHGPACIAFLSSPSLGVWGHFAKTWVSLQTTTYKSKSNKRFDIVLQLTWELGRPSIQLLSKFELKIPPSYPQTTF